jgi:hypothetical protein
MELCIRKKKRIPARKKDIPNLGMIFQITKSPLKIDRKLLLPSPTDDTTPGAVPAVGRTPIGNKQKNAIWIPVH